MDRRKSIPFDVLVDFGTYSTRSLLPLHFPAQTRCVDLFTLLQKAHIHGGAQSPQLPSLLQWPVGRAGGCSSTVLLVELA